MSKKELMIANQICAVRIADKTHSPKLEIIFAYPKYLKESSREAEELTKKLAHQLMGGDIKIKGLSLTWNEDDV